MAANSPLGWAERVELALRKKGRRNKILTPEMIKDREYSRKKYYAAKKRRKT